MKSISIAVGQSHGSFQFAKWRITQELSRILNATHGSRRSVVKYALRRFRNIRNALQTDLLREIEADHQSRERREEWSRKRIMMGGQMW